MVNVGAGTGAAVLESKLKIIVRTADRAQHGNRTEAFRELEIAKMETHEKTDNKSNIAVMK